MTASEYTLLINSIKASVERGRSIELERLLRQALSDGILAEEILREGLLPGMRSAGEVFLATQTDIPRILAAARAMQKGLDLLEPYLEASGSSESRHIGKAILGTVEGDLHEVGKNLVGIMFRGAGFDVIDLGVDVSDRQFIRAIKENPDASIVCISSLLTTSNAQMKKIVSAVKNICKDRQLKIMVGGGSVTREFARAIGADAYTENAVDAAETARAFILHEQN